MPKIRLTATAVSRLQPPQSGQVEYYDTHLRAFGLRVSYSGTKAWFVMTRVDGKLTRVTLGRYPALPLAEARDKARSAVEHAKGGGDPRTDRGRGASAQGERASHHVRESGDAVHGKLRRARAAAEYGAGIPADPTRVRYTKLVLAPDHCPHEAGRLDVLSRIEQRGAPAAANRALAYLSKFFNWCLEQDLITVSPTDRVRPLSSARSRDRVLSEDELYGSGEHSASSLLHSAHCSRFFCLPVSAAARSRE